MNSAEEFILKAKRISIVGHDDEDADSVGSCLAMRLALMRLGKDAKCYFSAPVEKRLEFMGGGYTVFDETAGYEADDLCICLDCADIKRLGKRVTIFENAKNTLSFDHHETNTRFAQINVVDAEASATAEVLFCLFSEMGIAIDADIAKNLYAAISADTGSFKYSNVTERTMKIAAELIAKGIDHAEIARLLHDTEEISVMRCKAEMMRNVEEHFGGRLVIVTADDPLFEKYGITERDSGDIVDMARKVKGCEIAVSVRDTADKVKISFRSNGELSVSGIAQKFGGGGHCKAAGAKITGRSAEEIKRDIIEACGELLDD